MIAMRVGIVAAASLWFAGIGVAEEPSKRGYAEQRLADGRALVDQGDNTTEVLSQALRALDDAIVTGLPPELASQALASEALAWIRMGELEQDNDRKLRDFERSAEAAKAAIESNPKNPEGHFMWAAAKGSWGKIRGTFRAMFLLGDIRRALRKALELDPDHAFARLTLGKIEEALPVLAGGSNARAEATYREVLQRDPCFTRAMLELADLLSRTGRKAEAIAWAKRARDEQTPTRPNEWRKFDRERAQKLIAAFPLTTSGRAP